MTTQTIDLIAGGLFATAVVHTFAAKQIERLSHEFPRHAGLFHLLSEVEVVFGFWALVLISVMAIVLGSDSAVAYAESRNFTEPLFVFVVMVVAGSRPVLSAVLSTAGATARVMPLPHPLATAWLGLAAVPLVGSLVTEPAAMTIAALLLSPLVFRKDIPEPPKYFAMGVLFVNVSIGGTLTSFAAPPVLMVAGQWGRNSEFMVLTFGWKAAVAVLVNASVAAFVLRKHLYMTQPANDQEARAAMPLMVVFVHLALLAGIVLMAHHTVIFLGLFLLFLGIAQAYERYRNPLLIREALLVAFFLPVWSCWGDCNAGGCNRWFQASAPSSCISARSG